MSVQRAALVPADITASVYEYSRPERNPFAWYVAGLIAAFAIYGLSLGAAPMFWICLAFFAVVSIWVVWGKNKHGLRLDEEMMTISPARNPVLISLYLIQSVRYVTDGNRRFVEITCRNGRIQKLDLVHFPRPQTLAALLEHHRIVVT